MSKKKQLTGKKTKLAELPLTRVLSQRMAEAEAWEPAPAPVEATSKQLPLSWERLEEGAAGLLAAAYLLILQDLLDLKTDIAAPGDSPEPPENHLPANLPPLPRLKQILRQTRLELGDLHRLLSP